MIDVSEAGLTEGSIAAEPDTNVRRGGPRGVRHLALWLFVLACLTTLPANAEQRTYYIAAEDLLWDYAPSYPSNRLTGKDFQPSARVFVDGASPQRIGRRYWKALYREYTDASFSTLKPRPTVWRHLGALGPVVRAEVGDTIVVVFKNNLRDKRASIHPHGVFYAKASEGANYVDGLPSTEKPGAAVAPGATFTYTWRVPPRAGPGPNDPSSIVWLYHSHVDSPADTNAGLIGAIVVTRSGMARADGSPKDVDRELVTLFTVMDENASTYLSENIEQFAPQALAEDDGFIESNLMHAVNGYVYANLPDLDMVQGERVRWYLLALGTEVDLHTPHWHGNTVSQDGHNTDVVELLPASMKTVTMVADNPGTWLYHCHVNDHIKAGMTTLYRVLERTAGP